PPHARNQPTSRDVLAGEFRTATRWGVKPRAIIFRQEREKALIPQRFAAEVPGMIRKQVTAVHIIARDIRFGPSFVPKSVVVRPGVPAGMTKVNIALCVWPLPL